LTKSGTDVGALQELILAEKNIIDGIIFQNENWELTIQVFHFFKTNKKRLEIFLEKKPSEDAPLQRQILFYNLDYIYNVMNGEPTKGLASLDLMIYLFEKNPTRIKDDPSSYARVMNNKVSYFIFQKQYTHVLSLLEKIRAIPTTYQLKNAQNFSIKLQLRTYNIELEMYRDIKEFGKGVEVIAQAEKYLLENEKIIPPDYHVMLPYQFAYIYFMQKEYSKSLRWVNEIIQTPFKNYRKDLQSYARILNLMIHFELGNIIVLKYAVENCRRFLKKPSDFRGQASVLPFAKILLHFFSKICNAPHSYYSQLFEKLKVDLLDAEPQILNDNILDYLDIKSWLVEKLK